MKANGKEYPLDNGHNKKSCSKPRARIMLMGIIGEYINHVDYDNQVNPQNSGEYTPIQE